MRRFLPMILVPCLLAAIPAGAHEESAHVPATAVSPSDAPPSPPTPPTPHGAFPLDIETAFELVDPRGEPVTNADFSGGYVFVFFGFAHCQGICPTAYRAMGEAADILVSEGERLQPLLITIDPVNETPEVLAEARAQLHPRILPLTGSEAAVERVMRGFHVEADFKGRDALGGAPIFAHGSYIYLLGPGGELLSVLPPILGAERLAEIARGYITREEG